MRIDPTAPLGRSRPARPGRTLDVPIRDQGRWLSVLVGVVHEDGHAHPFVEPHERPRRVFLLVVFARRTRSASTSSLKSTQSLGRSSFMTTLDHRATVAPRRHRGDARLSKIPPATLLAVGKSPRLSEGPARFPSSHPEWEMPESGRHGRLCEMLFLLLRAAAATPTRSARTTSSITTARIHAAASLPTPS